MNKEQVEKPGESTHSAKFDRCVQHVRRKGDVDNAFAVCQASLGEESFKAENDTLSASDIFKIESEMMWQQATKSQDPRITDEGVVRDEFFNRVPNIGGNLLFRDMIAQAFRLLKIMKSEDRVRMTMVSKFGLEEDELNVIMGYAIGMMKDEDINTPDRILDKSFKKEYTAQKRGQVVDIRIPSRVNAFKDFWQTQR